VLVPAKLLPPNPLKKLPRPARPVGRNYPAEFECRLWHCPGVLGEMGTLADRRLRGDRRHGSPSGDSAGPEITEPSVAKRDPWHGQSQVFSLRFHRTRHPMWVQVAERTVSAPERSR
jgi:hypothetical protein